MHTEGGATTMTSGAFHGTYFTRHCTDQEGAIGRGAPQAPLQAKPSSQEARTELCVAEWERDHGGWHQTNLSLPLPLLLLS